MLNLKIGSPKRLGAESVGSDCSIDVFRKARQNADIDLVPGAERDAYLICLINVVIGAVDAIQEPHDSSLQPADIENLPIAFEEMPSNDSLEHIIIGDVIVCWPQKLVHPKWVFPKRDRRNWPYGMATAAWKRLSRDSIKTFCHPVQQVPADCVSGINRQIQRVEQINILLLQVVDRLHKGLQILIVGILRVQVCRNGLCEHVSPLSDCDAGPRLIGEEI